MPESDRSRREGGNKKIEALINRFKLDEVRRLLQGRLPASCDRGQASCGRRAIPNSIAAPTTSSIVSPGEIESSPVMT